MDHGNLSFYKAFFETPPLWVEEFDGLKQFALPKIDFARLEIKSIPSNLRLGHQLEHVFAQLIQHSKEYNLIAHNIAIRRNKVSLGEIDFIIQNVNNKQFIHIELTYKFYLFRLDDTIVEHQLIGPNKRDSFRTKKEKIKNHQIPLLYSQEGISALSTLGIKPTELLHQVCFKCQLFIPYTVHKLHLAPLNSDCIAGRWISYTKFNTNRFFNYKYYLPSKPEWLLMAHHEVVWLTFNEVLSPISNKLKNNSSPLLWIKTEDLKIEKLFIVWW